jgi:hypothetical protein
MKVHRRLSDFPQKLKIYNAVKKGSSTLRYIDSVNHIDELEDCIIQALLDKDNDYYVEIENFDEHNFYKNSTRINLTDEDIFNKLDNMFKSATMFPMISYNLMESLRHKPEDIEEAKTLYEKYYGKI